MDNNSEGGLGLHFDFINHIGHSIEETNKINLTTMQTETINIPKEVLKRIENKCNAFKTYDISVGYHSGATSEAIKTKGLLDALKETKQAIEWMNNNMSVDYRSFQEHYGNLFMNTQHKIDDSINNYLNK